MKLSQLCQITFILTLILTFSSISKLSADVLHYDDVIITGSECVGFDCVNGESFSFDTIRLKENNLRIHFDDTSTAGSYPRNDWRITINDSANGGASYFSIDDASTGRAVFKVEAGAPSNSLYVDDGGRIGIKTATPSVEIHVKDGDTPTLRLEQDGSSGFVPQTWDIAGNETNFFFRDVTGGSRLFFRAQPGSPNNSLTIKDTGNIGIGTWSPAFPLEIERTGANASVVVDRTDGATNYMNATADFGNFGTTTNHPLRLATNSAWRMRINTDGSLTMSLGGGFDGTWNDASSRELKENIQGLKTEEAMKTFAALNPVTYNYKASKAENRVGFIAEDVPETVAMNNRKSLNSMDIVAVLTKVVQEQQRVIEEMQRRLDSIDQQANLQKGIAYKVSVLK